MQVVIEVSEEQMDMVRNSHRAIFADVYTMMANIIKNGTPLPKGHGRLIDVSNLLTVTDYDGEHEKTYVLYDEIENADTIIEADKEREE